MKLLKFFVASVLTLSVATTIVAASKKSKEILSQTFDAHIHCESCEKKIMNTLPFKKGIKDVKVDMSTQQITVKYDAAKSSDAAIIKSLKDVDIAAKVEQKVD